jgi:hypothetical protein
VLIKNTHEENKIYTRLGIRVVYGLFPQINIMSEKTHCTRLTDPGDTVSQHLCREDLEHCHRTIKAHIIKEI